ncbi:hypothetical protein ACS3SW_20965 [Roseobacteraceae bacterium S113]
MCTLCAATQTFDPARHETIMTAWADIYEGTDAPASTTTPYSIAVGDTFFGSIGTSTDWDVIEISLEAGETYLLEMRGQDSGAGTLIDPVIGLWREGSGYLAVDDNAGTGLDARITFTASATGTYYVVADAISDTGTGSYQLSLSTTAPPPPPTVPRSTISRCFSRRAIGATVRSPGTRPQAMRSPSISPG